MILVKDFIALLKTIPEDAAIISCEDKNIDFHILYNNYFGWVKIECFDGNETQIINHDIRILQKICTMMGRNK